MRLCRPVAILPLLCLSVGLNGGCLSLSMLNRETPDIKHRLDSLEQRVSALESAGGCRGGQPIIVPGPGPQGPGTYPAR